MNDWRPIALCNVIYKIVAKVLANRLKNVLDKCISVTQFAFVPRRSILDNVMAAIEIIHHMKSKVKDNVGEVALKLDISKAYDKIEWNYLREVMIKMVSLNNGLYGLCCVWKPLTILFLSMVMLLVLLFLQRLTAR